MPTTAAVPRLNKQAKPNSAGFLRNMPVIEHPMARLGDHSQLMVTGSGSLDKPRPQTVTGYPINVATCVSWAESDLVTTSTKKKRYTKKAMVTGSRTDREVLELVMERLVDGFQGIRQMFKANDPGGEGKVSKDSLLRIMYTCIGYISEDAFDRMLLNLGLDKKEWISFDMFVSRFNECEDVRRQWMTPVRRAAQAQTDRYAHPEESLRDCDTNEWAQLKVAPHAEHLLIKALREKKVDLRSMLPDVCFLPNGVVTKLQMRKGLLDLGINLTDMEYKRFWDRYDRDNRGAIPLKKLYLILNLTPNGELKKERRTVTKPKLVRSKTAGVPGRPAAKAARDFALRHQKVVRPEEQAGLQDFIKVEGIRPASARDRTEVTLTEAADEKGDISKEMSEALARSKIRAVMHQKPQGKFECVLDCLNHKFEERYAALNMAFKLFDIHDDGHVMHIDFRRVLTEFGFPVTALQLALLVQRFGMSLKHGLISYKQLLAKLLNRSDALTSRVIDDAVHAKLEGGNFSSTAVETDTDEDSVARRLVEYLQQDYVSLALTLLRSDRRRKGLLAQGEMREAVERCLGNEMTEKQWREFRSKLPCDLDGRVRYGDFMLGLNNGEPGSWNLLTVGSVSVPRNKVVYAATEEVQRLERAKSEILPSKHAKAKDSRSVDELRTDLAEFFTDHLQDVEQRFRELDKKSHKGFSQWQFGALLNLCGFPMTETELGTLWISLRLPDDLSTFEDLLQEFSPSYKLKQLKDKEETSVTGGPSWTKDSWQGQKRTVKSAVPPQKKMANGPSPAVAQSVFLTRAMQKAKLAVLDNWEYLRQGFRRLDPNGLGSVAFQQMQQLVDGLGSGLTVEERNQLCEQVDFRKNGRCNYLAFMKAFSDPIGPQTSFAYSPRVHILEKKPTDASQSITVSDALLRVRTKLIKQYKNLRRGFVRNDRSRTGRMTIADFKRVLGECAVPVSEEDFYFILSEFDSNLDGRISYQEFLDALLRVG